MGILSKSLLALSTIAGIGYLATTESCSKQIFHTLSAPEATYKKSKITIDEKVVTVDKTTDYYVPFENIPDTFLDALIATEDKTFRENESAMNQKSFFRQYKRLYGGDAAFSGIATQLAKWHFDGGKTSGTGGKLKQLAYAQQELLDNPEFGDTPEERKKKIIEMYVNETKSLPGGQTLGAVCMKARGIDLRSKKASLAPRQAATLVAALKGPSKYNGFSKDNYHNIVNEKNGKITGRGVQVLKNMVDAGVLSPEQYEEQKQLLLENLPIKRARTANEMRERDSRLEDAYNKEVHSLDQTDIQSIELTINPEKQLQATEIVNARIHTINTEDLSEQGGGAEGFAISVTQDGQIERYVPGVNKDINQADALDQMKFNPGSMIKPIFVAFCLQKGYITTNQTFSNTIQKVTAPGPGGHNETRERSNADGKYSSSVTIESILRNSLNCGIADIVNKAGDKAGGTSTLLKEFNTFVENITGAELGVSPDNFIGQGGMHLTPKQFIKLYLVLANEGKIQDNIRFVEYTITKNGKKQLTSKSAGKQVLKPEIVKNILRMTSDKSFGGSRKTGTVSNHTGAGTVAVTRDKKVILVGYQFPAGNSDPYRKLFNKLQEAGVHKDSISAAISTLREQNTTSIYILHGNIIPAAEAIDLLTEELLPDVQKINVPLEWLRGTSSMHAKPMMQTLLKEVEDEKNVKIQIRKAKQIDLLEGLDVVPEETRPTEKVIEGDDYFGDAGNTIHREDALAIVDAAKVERKEAKINAHKEAIHKNFMQQGKHPHRHDQKMQSMRDKTKRS